MNPILENLRLVIKLETGELEALYRRVDGEFVRAVEMICAASGKVILSGLGKSGAVARKIAATFTSTGTPAVYIHPVEGAHGDFGLIQKGDVAILISKSGNGEELHTLIPFLNSQDIPIIAVTAGVDSLLARSSHCVLDASVSREACPHDLAPTSSTTVALVVGDALAVSVLQHKGFTDRDFARLHPAGALGKKLLLTVGDILENGRELPLVKRDTPLKEIILEITRKRYGAALVVDENGRLLTMITDGDLRRLMEKTSDLERCTAADFPMHFPKTVGSETLAAVALRIMREHRIQQLVVVDGDSVPRGIVHLHHILQAGVL